jgi:hypothetical protein
MTRKQELESLARKKDAFMTQHEIIEALEEIIREADERDDFPEVPQGMVETWTLQSLINRIKK